MPAPAPAEGQATRSTPVVVGVAYRATSAGAGLAGALALTEAPGDVAGQAGAVASWVNAHGGIAGRSLVLRLAGFDPAIASSYGAAFTAACTSLATGVPRPVAVVGAIEEVATQAGCLASRGIPLVGDGPMVGDGKLFADAGPYLFAPGSMAVDRLADAEVRILLRDGFLGRGSRVGIVRVDGQILERTAGRVRSALAAADVGLAPDQVLPAARTLGDAPSLVARAAVAVLQMRRAGVDRVIFLDSGIAAATFMRQAERGGLRPRYALNSTMAPAQLPGQVPAAQLRGAQGVGFSPLLDVAASGEPEAPESRRRCEGIYRAARILAGGRTAAGQFAALSLCDSLLAVRTAVETAHEMSGAGIAAALERVGASRPSAVALATKLGNDRHDGGAAVRRVRFEDACGCMRYFGGLETAP